MKNTSRCLPETAAHRQRWLVGFGCLIFAACEPYRSPCQISESRVVLEGGSFQLQRINADQLVALGSPGLGQLNCSTPDECMDAYADLPRSVVISVLTTEGEILESHTIELPESAGSSSLLGLGVRNRLWTGQGVALMTANSEDLPTDENGEHKRSFLSYQHVDLGSVATVPIELPDTSCVDCGISVITQFFGNRVIVLFRQGSSVLNPSAIPEPWRFLFLNIDGNAQGSGVLEWASSNGFVSLDMGQHGDGLVLAIDGEVWLVDANLVRIAGPVVGNIGQGLGGLTSAAMTADWRLDLDTAATSWVQEGNVMLKCGNISENTVGSVRRLSSGGTVDAVFIATRFVTTVFSDAGLEYAAMVMPGDRKLGGDLVLNEAASSGGIVSTPLVLAETPEGNISVFTTTTNALERSEVSCEQ